MTPERAFREQSRAGRQLLDRIGKVLALALLVHGSGAVGVARADYPDATHLAPGQYVWHPEVAPVGPVVVVISLDEQRAYVYRNGIAIGLSTISSGRDGYETPTGVFTVLQKAREHYSNKYDDAPMPFMVRLTWDGVSLHAGSQPGHRASHGCIRLPATFAEKLFDITQRGQTVVIASGEVGPPSVVHPAVLAPVTPLGMVADDPNRSAAAEPEFEWTDGIDIDGPVTVLASISDRSVYVVRNGRRIARAALEVRGDFHLGGSLLFVIGAGFETKPSSLDPARPRREWTLYRLGAATAGSDEDLGANLRVATGFARRLYDALAPGTTVLVTDLPAVRGENYEEQTILESE